VAASGDGSDVPADGLSCVEIGRLDEEQLTFRVFRRNPREHIVVHIVGNGLVERSRIRQSVIGERSCGGKTFLIGAATINIVFAQSQMGVRGPIRES
jgi:hypothetical protein